MLTTSIRPRPAHIRMLAAAAAASAALFALPAIASADTFCVHSPAGCSGKSEESLKAALTDAAGNGVGTRDTIQLAAGTFKEDPALDAAGNAVDIVGAGQHSTILEQSGSNQTLLQLLEPNSTVSQLEVRLTGTGDEVGIDLKGKLDKVNVLAAGGQKSSTGVWVSGPTASITDSAILVQGYTFQTPWVKAVVVSSGGSATISESTLIGEEAVLVQGGTADLQRTVIRGQRGVEVISGGYAFLRNSTVQTPAVGNSPYPEAALLARGNGTTLLDAIHVTIEGDAPYTQSPSTGVVVDPFVGQGAIVSLTDSVVDNFKTTAQVSAGGTLNTIWSAYDFGTVTGAGAHPHANDLDLTDLDPRFASGGGGQFALRHDSPLIDAGDPQAGTSGPVDIAGLDRLRDGDGTGAARVDIGAYEYQHAAPTLTAGASPSTADPGQLVKFTATAEDIDKADKVDLVWSFDDATVTSGATVQHAFATSGAHTATVTATDSAGLTMKAAVHLDVTGTTDLAGSPSSAGSTPTASGSGAISATAPLLQAVRLSPTIFRPLGTQPHGASRRVPAGSTLRFKLSQPAVITVVIQRPKATTWVTAGKLVVKRAAGAGSVRIAGRAHGRPLPAGHYRLRVVARNQAGLSSAPARAKFTIVR
jgi:PKD domain